MAAPSALGRRLAATCSVGLRPLEDKIGLGLRGRLPALAAVGSKATPAPRIAVLGTPSLEFAASLRAVWASGASAAPIDVRHLDQCGVADRIAEAQVELAVLAGAAVGSPEEKAVLAATRSLGAPCASAAMLHAEGAACEATGIGARAEGGRAATPLLLFTQPPQSTGITRAAQVSSVALEQRTAQAIDAWGLTEADVVLPIGIRVDSACAVVDALEAPLAAGCQVALQAAPTFGSVEAPPGTKLKLEEPSAMWASVLEAKDATVIVTSTETLRSFVDEHDLLGPVARRELRRRFAGKGLRLSVALCSRGTTPSQELSDRWAAIFHCPLTWHFSCAEAGSLFSVGGAAGSVEGGACAPSLEWQVDDEQGDLHVKGDTLFTGYHGRKRSTAEAFDEDGFFVSTGQRVAGQVGTEVSPQPAVSDQNLDVVIERHFTREPNLEISASSADWKQKKTPMKTYLQWRTAWGAVLLTKKSNQSHQVYKSKFR